MSAEFHVGPRAQLNSRLDDTHPLFVQKSASNFFSFLNIPDILAARQVCHVWNRMLSDTIILSKAKEQNAEEIAELVVTAFSKGDKFRKVGQRRTSGNDVIEDMKSPQNTWFIISFKAQIIAAMLYSNDSDKVSSIHMLSAHPSYWGQGLGVCLLRKAELEAKEQGKEKLELSAAQTNLRLIKYYEKFGFSKKEGCREEEYFPPDLQLEYLIPEFQGYEPDGRAKLRNYDMEMSLDREQISDS